MLNALLAGPDHPYGFGALYGSEYNPDQRFLRSHPTAAQSALLRIALPPPKANRHPERPDKRAMSARETSRTPSLSEWSNARKPFHLIRKARRDARTAQGHGQGASVGIRRRGVLLSVWPGLYEEAPRGNPVGLSVPMLTGVVDSGYTALTGRKSSADLVASNERTSWPQSLISTA